MDRDRWQLAEDVANDQALGIALCFAGVTAWNVQSVLARGWGKRASKD